jgi:hypothetical protein
MLQAADLLMVNMRRRPRPFCRQCPPRGSATKERLAHIATDSQELFQEQELKSINCHLPLLQFIRRVWDDVLIKFYLSFTVSLCRQVQGFDENFEF